ncbi:MAG: lytic transglycosylase domain-containing protein [Firmicutes bacterium]|nr:lytic transglycosylase domain-containing protein [Bacillota bacterium]
MFVIVLLIDNSTTILKRIYPLKFGEYVFKYSEINGIDPYLVFAIIKAESSFNPYAKSVKNARGLMQITEKTAMWGVESIKIENFSLDDLYDPETNIKIGCWYIRQLINEFNNNTDLVIAAYNGGSGNVKEWLNNRDYSKYGSSLDIIPFRETERFLKRVKSYYYVYTKLYSKKA